MPRPEKPTRANVHIRPEDAALYRRVKRANFSQFVSDMLSAHGEAWLRQQLEPNKKGPA